MNTTLEDEELDKKAVIRTSALDGEAADPIAIGFNPKYVVELLTQMTSDQITQLGPDLNCSIPPNSSTHESAKDCRIRCHIALEVRRLNMGSVAEAEGCRG